MEVETYPVEAQYIRNIIESSDASGTPFKVIVCMSPKASHYLKKARRLQSDTSYKRVVDYQELVIGHWDTDAHTSMYSSCRSNMLISYPGLVFCRLYINSESAEAHKLAFDEMNRLVEIDTGSGLRWRHLDAATITDLDGTILQWTSDQGGGQAKGRRFLLFNFCILTRAKGLGGTFRSKHGSELPNPTCMSRKDILQTLGRTTISSVFFDYALRTQIVTFASPVFQRQSGTICAA